MTKEDKQLLLKVLCAMLPYGVICKLDGADDRPRKLLAMGTEYAYVSLSPEPELIEDLKPYLRPMSSMTEEEFFNYSHLDLLDYSNDGFEMPNFRSIDWLNSYHFDYRGLIEKGLALEAPEDMYKNK